MLSGGIFAQEQSENENPYVYQETAETDAEDDEVFPGTPGDTAPIDQYIPVLVLAAAGIIIYAKRKKIA